MELKDIIKKYREDNNLSYREFADRTKTLSHAYISKIEKQEDIEVGFTALKSIAKAMNIEFDYLLSILNPELKININEEDKDIIKIPVLGVIPAGIPIEAIEQVLDYEEIPKDWCKGDKEYFGLKIKGDSMYPKYIDKDVVIFLKTCDFNSGDECCVLVNGDNATFKKILRHDQGITLQPLNPMYDIKMYSNEDVEKLPIKIIGVAKELRRKL